MPSRTCVTVVPLMAELITEPTESVLRPSSRAWSWSITMRTTREGSIQS